jgi:hypothetical protein
MKYKYFALVAATVFSLAISVFGATSEELARNAASDNPVVAADAVKNLRAMGQEGLDALFVKYAVEIRQYGVGGGGNDAWNRIAAAVDTVAMQRDAYASQLFWQTNLERAMQESQKTGKPILSLRLLGNLNEEFSCANSRLFRAVLYSNAEISKYLRENYVLHWQTVRPAPRITIDFGDGRKMERTLTGNSIHYVLDSKGVIIDALPGLYSPQAFLKFLQEAKAANDLPSERGITRKGQYAAYRKKTYDRIAAERGKNLREAKIALTELKAPAGKTPTAIEASIRTMSKMIVINEIAILDAISDDFSKYRSQMNLDDWRKLAALHAADAKLDGNGRAFVERQVMKTVQPRELAALVKNLEDFAALDTTLNDYVFRTKIYSVLSENNNDRLEQINERIYAQVFLTPSSDPWLGLYSSDVYTALDGNGIIQ